MTQQSIIRCRLFYFFLLLHIILIILTHQILNFLIFLLKLKNKYLPSNDKSIRACISDNRPSSSSAGRSPPIRLSWLPQLFRKIHWVTWVSYSLSLTPGEEREREREEGSRCSLLPRRRRRAARSLPPGATDNFPGRASVINRSRWFRPHPPTPTSWNNLTSISSGRCWCLLYFSTLGEVIECCFQREDLWKKYLKETTRRLFIFGKYNLLIFIVWLVDNKRFKSQSNGLIKKELSGWWNLGDETLNFKVTMIHTVYLVHWISVNNCLFLLKFYS